jgi:hypothetical protein
MLFTGNMILALSLFLKPEEIAVTAFNYLYRSVRPLEEGGMSDGM